MAAKGPEEPVAVPKTTENRQSLAELAVDCFGEAGRPYHRQAGEPDRRISGIAMHASRKVMAAALVVVTSGFAAPGEAAFFDRLRRAWDGPAVAPSAELTEGEFRVAQRAPGDEASVRMERIEAQMRTLTGQLEEITHQLSVLREQMQRLQEDTDFRLREVEGGGEARRSEAPAREEPPAAAARIEEPAPPAEPAAVDVAADEPQRGDPPRDLGEVPVAAGEPGAGAPLDLSALIRRDGSLAIDPPADAPRQVAVAPSGDPRGDYDLAYRSILSGDYESAEAGFRAFLSAYPDDRLASDAQYWIAESLYTRGLYKEAAAEFLAGFKTYPNAPKAPDTLLKLGMSLAGLGEHDAACASYAQVLSQFPRTSVALRQRVEAEQASARC